MYRIASIPCVACSVLPSAEDSKLEPDALYAEDVEQARHFYQVCHYLSLPHLSWREATRLALHWQASSSNV
jgi:hypothetical protein